MKYLIAASLFFGLSSARAGEMVFSGVVLNSENSIQILSLDKIRNVTRVEMSVRDGVDEFLDGQLEMSIGSNFFRFAADKNWSFKKFYTASTRTSEIEISNPNPSDAVETKNITVYYKD